MRHNVTTPGGFFVGLGGVAAFCAVAIGVNLWVGKPSRNKDLEPQMASLGLLVKEDKDKSKMQTEQAALDGLLDKAAKAYNGGKKPDLNNIDDLRGVVRFREAQTSSDDATAVLTAKSTVEGKNVLQAAIAEVVKEIAAKKPAASTVKIDLIPPAADSPVSMPNVQGNGASTILFQPIAPPAAPAPTGPAAPAPAPQVEKPQVSTELTAQPIAAITAQSRPPILNWSDSK